MSIYYSGFYIKTEIPIEMEVAIPVLSNDVNTKKLPKIKVASIVHEGSFETIGETYDLLLKWISANQYKAKGPVREIYHKGEWLTEDTNKFITEIQIPIS